MKDIVDDPGPIDIPDELADGWWFNREPRDKRKPDAEHRRDIDTILAAIGRLNIL